MWKLVRKCPPECGPDALLGECPFGAQETDHAVDVAWTRVDAVVVCHLGIEIQIADLPRNRADLVANIRGHFVERAILAYERQCFLWTNPLDARIEVRTHEDGNVNELLPCNPERGEHPLAVDELRFDIAKGTPTGEKLLAGNRQKPYEPWRSKQLVAFEYARATSPAALAAASSSSYRWCAAAESDERKELIELAVAIDGEPFSAELLQVYGFFDGDRGQRHAHAEDAPLSGI
jgi:hypothetical protein